MKQKKMKTQPGLHLVGAEETAARPQPTNNEEKDLNPLIGQAVRRYEQLRAAVDRELLAEQKDIHKLGELMPEMQQLREALARHGVHVQ